MDLGSSASAIGITALVRALLVPAELEQPGVKRARKKGFMKPNAGKEYNKILINHWRWLQAQGPSYKQQATSCKLQAASLTRKLYNDIQEYTGEKKNENK